jgi:sec-independent protein translocase protein TatA
MDTMPLNLMFGVTWGPMQIIVVLLLVVLLFGKGKISDVMGDFAKGIKSFKKGLADDDTPPSSQQTAQTKPIEHEMQRTETKTPAGTTNPSA